MIGFESNPLADLEAPRDVMSLMKTACIQSNPISFGKKALFLTDFLYFQRFNNIKTVL